jgi:prophage regulatory protein
MTTKARLLGSASPIVSPTDQTDQRLPRLNRMFRLRDLPEFVGLRRTQIGELIKAGEFPKPILLSETGRAVAWLEADLIAWQNARIAARNSEAA